MKYIATRPRAERLGDHGLFSDEDGVNLEQAMRELDQYTGNVWTHILSLKREDAARLVPREEFAVEKSFLTVSYTHLVGGQDTQGL